MPGTPVFSTDAARVLVDAYLAQPEGQRDLRRALAAAKQGTLLNGISTVDAPKMAEIVQEIAAMSKSQAYELLRQDPRYQPSTVEQADELSQEVLANAREIIQAERDKKPQHRDLARLKDAQRLIHQVQWAHANVLRTREGKTALSEQRAREHGLTGLLT